MSAQPSSPALSTVSTDAHDDLHFDELGSPSDAIQCYSKLLSRPGNAVRLHCSVPTWCPDGDDCLDLHDLHEMRNRALILIRDLVQQLRSSGIPASYRLAPSSSSCCLVCALPEQDASKVKHAAIEAVSHAKYNRQKFLLADLASGPALIIT